MKHYVGENAIIKELVDPENNEFGLVDVSIVSITDFEMEDGSYIERYEFTVSDEGPTWFEFNPRFVESDIKVESFFN